MSEQAKILEFISFCIEMFAARDSVPGRDVYARFAQSGVLDYLEANYEPLHTQGFNYILSCIDDFLSTRKIA